jgi:hypothetical protein
MAEEGAVAVFLAELDHQIGQVMMIYSILEGKHSRWTGAAVSAERVESAGYWLHNLYCAFEDLFKIVAAFFENQLPADGTYPVSLLKKMVLRIEKVRPTVLSPESYTYLNELRGFRHVFRHAHTFGLDDERVLFLLRRVLSQEQTVMHDLRAFRGSVATLAEDEENRA